MVLRPVTWPCGGAVQVKDVEAAAARAAFESSHIIEEAMAQAADVRRQATQQAQQEVGPDAAASEIEGISFDTPRDCSQPYMK